MSSVRIDEHALGIHYDFVLDQLISGLRTSM
jgi:hypothetical protein